ncbi:MinD/ParA family protein [Streptomyces sp. Je 1-4]|uniref:MinD/ParA family ATP-binding protein n=1 Tax=Streptomyces TaxID=1883 RepID=UPI0021DB4EE0|nr:MULTISPECIES: MinD/ParA family protein [unclassified Streptomyces]UYB43591.1 MinD/ParA family protein [Streptomyces sp. Je 1-4]UZQ39981.1 MinD/ParA family protein [Streptomyces sp. Je 1-4] [Streptomyces sp. Je 1-4 4N24]UZQ47398.1 MinD/ParA family protein [Streptomyces sp. Je 1-4] [Streptomyces sp. Je 1-4 4N24_ara]
MPSGDGWQGDVLRDLRGGADQGAQGPGGQAYRASAPGHALPAQGTQAPDATPGGGAPRQAGPYEGQEQQAGLPGGWPQQAGYQEQQVPAAYAPSPPPQSAPSSQPAQDKGLAGAVHRKPQHGESFAARAARALRRTLSSSAAREVDEVTRTAQVLQQPVTTGRQIAVTSIRGGSGKSTVAALLGTTYAHYRRDPVLFLEADPALGSLPQRLGAEALRWTTSDIADIVKPDMSLLDVTGYLVQLPNNAWLLPASQGQIGVMLDSRAYERVVVALRRYFGVMVIDCETLPAEVGRVALGAAHGRVLTTPATPEGIRSTYSVLQWMQGLPRHVMAGTVVVLTELVPHSGLDLDEAIQMLRSTGVSIQVLPYDRHLAAGGRIHTELLAHPTRQAAARLAADVFQLSQQRH